MKNVTKEQRIDGVEGYVYKTKGSYGFVDCEVKVHAEVGGHGCLYEIEMPNKICIHKYVQSGLKTKYHNLDDLLPILNHIFTNYNLDASIFRGAQKFSKIL